MISVSMTVNGKAVSAHVDPRTLLVQFLRENLRLTGTHVGCDTSQCGACVVHVDGRAIKSCTTLAVSCNGAHVTTIEGLAQGGKLHPMQQAFQDNHGLQCGFCTPGHDHDLGRHGQPPRATTSTRRRSATSSKATSAAAPATTTSSSRSRRARAKWAQSHAKAAE